MTAQASIGLIAIIVFFAALSGCANWSAERNAPRIGEHIEIDGVAMHVATAGPRDSVKPPIVLIHGASANLLDMKIALGDMLAKDRFVIMIDRPGRGYSERPAKGYALDLQARQINGVVKKLGVEKPIILGQSFGGAVALAYALQFQEEMSGLVLLAPVSHEWPGGLAWYNSLSQIPVAGHAFRRLVVPVYGQVVANRGVDENFAPNAAPENYAERSGLALLFRPGDFRSNAEDIAQLKRQIITQQTRYGELALPVAVLTGEDDTAVSPQLHAQALEREIEGATLTMLPNTGHALHHSQSDAIKSAIEEVAEKAAQRTR